MNSNFKRITMKNNLFLLIFMLFLCACEKEIDLNIANANPKMIVEGNILAGLDTVIAQQEIRLTQSTTYTGKSLLQPITDALVKVVEGSNTYIFQHREKGLYRADFVAKIGKTYRLSIVWNNNTYNATETISKGTTIDSLGVKFFPSSFGSPDGNFLVVNTSDPSSEKNYYLWKLYINDTLKINASPGNIYRAIQKDDFFNLPYDNFPIVAQDKAVMQQLNISQAMYNYYYSIFNLTGSSPLSGDVPPANVKGNIINIANSNQNALGYFGACSISIKTK
jgi:Domain of unknown function (DUF4249)